MLRPKQVIATQHLKHAIWSKVVTLNRTVTEGDAKGLQSLPDGRIRFACPAIIETHPRPLKGCGTPANLVSFADSACVTSETLVPLSTIL